MLRILLETKQNAYFYYNLEKQVTTLLHLKKCQQLKSAYLIVIYILMSCTFILHVASLIKICNFNFKVILKWELVMQDISYL